MANLAVGLSKTVVEGALARVRTVIEEDAKLRQKAQRDLVLISLEFEMMQSFLNIANDEMNTTKNNLVMTWVRHVRELAYDLEDCVEFVVHLDGKPIFWRRLLPACMVGSLPLDQAVMEIEDLKNRAEELSKSYSRYSNISEPASKLLMLQQQDSSWPTGATSSANMFAQARDAARRRQARGDLTQLITNKDNKDPHLQVISVWGTGGDLGTTTIIRKAYNDPEICKNFPCRVWVKLMYPFNPHEFIRHFMSQVYAADNHNKQGADRGLHVLTKMKAKKEYIQKEFAEKVNQKTYLVVLENLTDMVDWDAVRMFLPDMKNGSCIIVSTQHFEIASLCIGSSYQPLELKRFSPKHSVCAFFKEGSQHYRDKDENPMVCEVRPNLSLRKIPSFSMKVVADWMTKYPIVGRERQMSVLRRYTADACFSKSPVISVWGIAGIGKSALVRNLYYDRMLHSNQFDKYAWVNVSHPLSLRDFSRSLISDNNSEIDPIKECRELLSQHQCLVVIDDLESKDYWDLIKSALVSGPSSSVIIVITSEASVASYCTNNNELVLDVKGLQVDASIDLFRKEVQRLNPSCPLCNHTGADLEELILKCGGLPKVIVSIAALLATQTVTLRDTLRSLNHNFLHHLENNPECDSLEGLFDWMRTYFRVFPNSLKPCIFYLSVFPPQFNIRRRRLVRRWIAEGYSRDTEEESAVQKGEKFFLWLLHLSIIQQIPQFVTTAFIVTGMVACQVNGFIREYIVSRRTEENLVFELGPNCVLTTQRTGRHLVILDTWDRDRILFESIDFSRLRSLTVFGKWESFFISKSMKLLRVLDLEDAVDVKEEDLKMMVQQMLRLKFLSLRRRSEIFHMPNSLGDLRQLQTLDVRDTSIVTLPASIGKLQKLQHICAGSKDPTSTLAASSSRWPEFLRGRGLVGVKVPRAIGKLTALHTLGIINVGASGGKAIVEELKKLTQLHKLGVSGINSRNSKDFVFATSGHVHLESLLVQVDKDSQHCLDDIFLPWRNLQSLKLYGLQNKLPWSIRDLYKLRKLDLEMTTLHRIDIEFLGNLPELCILRLRLKQLEDDKLHFHAELYGEQLPTFEEVKILEIAYCSGQLLNVAFGSKSMKNLELLKVDCSGASYNLNGLNYLSELKQVLLRGANEEIKTAFEKLLLENHPETPPAVKLEQLPRSS